MPRVPRVTAPSTELGAVPTVYERSGATPDALRNPLAGEVQQLGAIAQQAGAVIQERTDADLVMQAETSVKNNYLQWEANARQRKGQQAWGVTKDAGEFWDSEAAKQMEGLSNPLQKKAFGNSVAKLKGQSLGAFAGFEADQRRASLDASAQASIVGSINLAAATPDDRDVLLGAKQDILARTQVQSQINGWPAEVRAAKEAEYLTNFHKQVIQSLAVKNPSKATEYFKANEQEIEGSLRAEIGAFATKATAVSTGNTAADEVWTGVGPKGDRDPVSLDKMEESIRTKLKGNDEAIKAGIANLRERTAAFKSGRAERDDQLEADVNKALLNGTPPSQIMEMPSFLSLSPEAGRKIMDYAENKQYRNEQRALTRAQTGNANEEREQRAMARRGMGAYLTYSNPQVLAGMSENQVLNLLPSLGNELTSHLMDKRRALDKPENKLSAGMDQDDFNHAAQNLGLKPFAAKTEDEKAQLGELKYKIENIIGAEQTRLKRQLSRDEKQALFSQEMARAVTVDPGMFSSNKQVPVVALSPDQIQRVVIPAAERSQVAEAMKTMFDRTQDPKYAPTDANLRRWYLTAKSPAAGRLLPNGK